jgi:hypothetical protein
MNGPRRSCVRRHKLWLLCLLGIRKTCWHKSLTQQAINILRECVRQSCDTTLALGVLATEWRLGNEELKQRLGASRARAE